MVKMKWNKKIAGIVLLVVILLFQAFTLVHMGIQKKGMHTDEFYSYILSNSYDTPTIESDNEVWNVWLSGSDFQKFLSVEKGEQFAYDKVYYNNTLDAHPPLFYFLLHTVCSFFPEQYTPWFGLALNIVITLLSQIILFFFAKEVTGSSLWGVVPVAIYGGMKAFFDTTIFIRMYSLLTLFTILLAWKHYHLVKNPQKRSTIVWCFTITFLGVFTQYYFAFVAFFMAGAVCFWMLCRRDWKTLLIYAAAMALAVVCVFVVYPAGITQISGSETNNVGNAVMGNLFDFSGWLAAIRNMLEQARDMLIPGIMNNLALVRSIAVISAILSFVFRKKDTAEKKPIKAWIKDVLPVISLFPVLIFTVAFISHISADFVYVRYIYNLFPLFALAVSVALYMIVKALTLHKSILAIGIIAICLTSTVNLTQNNNTSYLFSERSVADMKIIEACEDRPLIMLNKRTNHQPTGLLHIILEAQQVYLGDYNEVEDANELLSQVDCSNGVVFVILTDQYWSNGFIGDEIMSEIINNSAQLDSYNFLEYCDFSTSYLAYPASE